MLEMPGDGAAQIESGRALGCAGLAHERDALDSQEPIDLGPGRRLADEHVVHIDLLHEHSLRLPCKPRRSLNGEIDPGQRGVEDMVVTKPVIGCEAWRSVSKHV